jgi:hypothetical protein
MADQSLPQSDIGFDLHFKIHSMRLTFDPVAGRRTLYAAITIGSTTFWLQRWDTERCSRPSPFAFSSDRLMCWTAGSRRA